MWARGMWLWWAVPLPKGVSGQFISLLCMRVHVSASSLANSMSETQLYHFSNMDSLWPSTVCLQLLHKFADNTPIFFFKYSDDSLVFPVFFSLD